MKKDAYGLYELIDEFYGPASGPKVETGYFNTPLYPLIDVGDYDEPLIRRPIPSACLKRRHVVFAVRHPNKAIVITKGDASNLFLSAFGFRPCHKGEEEEK